MQNFENGSENKVQGKEIEKEYKEKKNTRIVHGRK